ncbi:OmpA family protein [Mycobacterium sp.]|jgi:peptidoglycan-binding protein ArfA|uniref:channel-forming protein ArfA/OmpATb n=1 Tax=Mycobacterium sp. TaxID=1785 RepID=UPI002B99E90A|nr:OmpA family protein [Mycobacterium sp.]HXB87848.1 OmpA family protein [Mycobacterium sp.]
MAGSDEAPEATQWRPTSRFYRRFPGLPWLVGLIVIPLLLAVIGHGELGRTRSDFNGPTGALPTLNAHTPSYGGAPNSPTIPPVALAPVSITRSGNDIKLSGDTPTPEAKDSLLAALKAGFGPDINIIDDIRINRDITSLDFSNAAPVFKAAASVADFGLTIKGDTITLIGTTGSGGQQDAVEQAADAAWPNLNIVDTMGIGGPVTASAPPGPAPALGPGNACAHLGSDLRALGPITFPTDGSALTPDAEQTLNQVADKLKACPAAKVTINGYTDNTGNDAINNPLSSNRADAVAGYLIAHGVMGDHLTAKGHGSADSVADNSSLDGQAKNRRVEIAVS